MKPERNIIPGLGRFSQYTIALLRLVYLAPGLNQRAYAHKALMLPLIDAELLVYSSKRTGQTKLTPKGHAFLRQHKLDHFGFEKRHTEQYPTQMANNAALMEAMSKFTGHYES